MDTQVTQDEQQGLSPMVAASPGIAMGEARRSFEALQGRLEAVSPAEVVTARIDVQRAAAIAHSVARRDGLPKRRAVFERLAVAGFCNLGVLDGLPALAEGAWYARQQQQFALAVASGANVPEEEVQRAYEVRARMQTTLEHWVGDDAELGPRLAFLRQGSGHQDLANDLQVLSALYQRDEVRSLLERDIKHYRPADVGEATRLAGVLFTGFGLGQEGEAARWTGLFQRAATLLLRAYDEHRVHGQYAFREQEDVTATYPSLYALLRSARSRRAPAGEPVDEGAPADDETPVAPV